MSDGRRSDGRRRNGVAMRAVASYVQAHSGCSKADVIRGTGSVMDSVNRAIQAGLIYADQDGPQASGPYRLWPVSRRP